MKLPIFVVSLSLSSNLITLPLATMASAEVSVPPSPLRIAQVDTTTQDDARRWGIRLNGYQMDYYKQHGAFAKTPEQILTVMDPKSSNYSFDTFKKAQQFYDFVVKETPDAIYLLTLPRSSGYGGYSTVTFFQRGPNRTLANQKSHGCYSSSGPAPKPIPDASGKTTCPGQKDPMADFFEKPSSSQPSQSSPATGSLPGNDGPLNEVKKKAPGILNSIFK
jgi:hypothetical protein